MRDIRFLLKPRYSNNRALIIGINDYKNAPPLSYAVNDAEEIREVLITDLSFSKDNIIYLANADATKENILRSYLMFTADDVELDERIFVFFAGHGCTRTGIRGEVGYLVPFDANMTDFSTFIRWDDLTRNAELIRAKHMLFIMDACYGGLALTRNIQPGSTRFLKDMLLRYSRQVLTAGKADEEVADSGGPLPNHSVFTGHLIEGLRGAAASEHGVITASGLMAYVYNKVANDKNSNQTPHYGYFDGDGDFIVFAPQLFNSEEETNKGIDELIVLPFVEEEQSEESLNNRITKVKKLLSNESSTIELHDFMIEKVRHFLSVSSEDHFKIQGTFSNDELLGRISKYENIISELCALTACVSYWAKPYHKQILQKILSRSSDRLDRQSGLVVLLNLRWYPLILEMYYAGIAAIEGERYDSLANIFYTKIGAPEYRDNGEEFFAESVGNAILELNRYKVFNQLPGYERNYTPLSEYLFKLLQPKLDDILFIGLKYESVFDEFEVFLALIVAELRKQKGRYIWGPIGRFGWKHSRGDNAPLTKIINNARAEGENWIPLKSGLFGGSSKRFLEIAEEYLGLMSTLNW